MYNHLFIYLFNQIRAKFMKEFFRRVKQETFLLMKKFRIEETAHLEVVLNILMWLKVTNAITVMYALMCT